ncbi:MAG: ATP-binding protein [Candidatus Baltobacteraceae bacterium]
MFSRAIASQLEVACRDTPVVLLSGARQVGKSTLARQAAQAAPGARISFARAALEGDLPNYVSLDDATSLAAARSDPEGFLERHASDKSLVIDEVQRAPDLLIAIKRDVDRDRRPGKYLLTGSANVLTIPQISESLAGRLEILPMWPLARCELEGVEDAFLGRVFGRGPLAWDARVARAGIVERAMRGGYPEAVARSDRGRRQAWFGAYISTIVQREIKNISAIEDESGILRILRTLATRSGGPRNIQTLAKDTGISNTTIQRYLALLKATFLVAELPAWYRNLDARLVKSPKMLLADSGLYASLLDIAARDSELGLLFETFVGNELLRLASFQPARRYSLLHFRTHKQHEVDFVIEESGRRIVGIEVKLSSRVGAGDFSGLRALSDAAGPDFHRGIVLYTGDRTLSFGEKLWAVPIDALWT